MILLASPVASVPRVKTMKLGADGLGVYNKSSGCNGISTCAPAFGIKSRPWSKNCPNNVNQELYPADALKSGVTFGICKTVDGIPV